MRRRPDEERPIGTEEAMGRGIIEMLSPLKIKSKTLSDLDDEQVGVLSLLEAMGKHLKIKELQTFCEEFRLHRISRFRLGRREIGGILAFSAFGIPEGGGRKKHSIKDLFSGFG